MFKANPLNANPTKWSNTLKQFVGKLLTNSLSVFDHFVGLALKGLRMKDSRMTSLVCRSSVFNMNINSVSVVDFQIGKCLLGRSTFSIDTRRRFKVYETSIRHRIDLL